MKRFTTATALTVALTAPAFAATEAEITTIGSYLPDADLSAWSETEVATAMNIITSTDSRSDIVGQLNALYDGETYAPRATEISDAEIALLDTYVDGVDYAALPQATVDAAIVAANSGMDDGEKQARIRALLIDDGAPMGDGNSATAAEAALINGYAPEIDVTALSDTEVVTALAIIYSAETKGEIDAKLDGLFVN